MFTVEDKANDARLTGRGCGEPWNLDTIPDVEMQFKDAVLDSKCQLFYDHAVSVYSVSCCRSMH